MASRIFPDSNSTIQIIPQVNGQNVYTDKKCTTPAEVEAAFNHAVEILQQISNKRSSMSDRQYSVKKLTLEHDRVTKKEINILEVVNGRLCLPNSLREKLGSASNDMDGEWYFVGRD
jgi:hypothetical protein